MILYVWVSLCLPAGCSDEVVPDGVPGNKSVVTFRLGVPPGDEVNYTRAGTIQDETEWKINRLKIYDFTIVAGDTVLSGVQMLEKSDAATTPAAGFFISNAGGGTACISLAAAKGSNHVFAIVANEAVNRFDSIMQVNVSTIDELRKSPSSRHLENGESCSALALDGFVMTGKTGMETITGDLTCTVKLQRIVARVDVVNNVSAEKNFKLRNIGIKNCSPLGYLFERGSDRTLTAEQWDYKSPVSQTQNINVSMEEVLTGGTCKKALYMYEYLQSRGDAPVLLLRYTLNGSENMISIPMTGFDIRRNRLYTLMIGDVSNSISTRVEYSLTEKMPH